MNTETEAAALRFFTAASEYLDRLNTKRPLVGAAAKAHAKKAAAAAVPLPKPVEKMAEVVEYTPPAAKAVEPSIEDAAFAAAPATALDPKVTLPAALTAAKAFVQRFQNDEPDGMTRLRTMLKGLFDVDKVGALAPDQQVKFQALLEKEMGAAS